MRHTNEYNKLHASSAAVSVRMLGFPILAAPGSYPLSAAHHTFLILRVCLLLLSLPTPKQKPSPVKILVGCGMERSSVWIQNRCDVTLYTSIIKKWKTRSYVRLKTEIPNPNLKWRNRYYSTVRCLGSLPRKPAKGSPDSDMYFTNLHFCSFFWT